ncbi:MAG: SUMF1/EgtB/PvdO family nonheme iron enzyme [Leptolyngbyaceae bacterium]|nr:SUMF1/EgtB/PvdO family nonheme iron enzyme [Leptolyngbyaceae bacterium]
MTLRHAADTFPLKLVVIAGVSLAAISGLLFSLARLRFDSSSSSAVEFSDRRDRCLADPAFVWIPSGEFVSGSDETERDAGYRVSAEGWVAISQNTPNTPESLERIEQRLRQQRWFDAEPPRERRSLPGFCLQQNLVTQAEYRAFVAATIHRAPDISADDYQEQGFLVHPYTDVEPYRWRNGTYPDGKAQHPVVLVSYDDAIAYAEWRSDQEGEAYRLPTALEWEKAARGEDGRYFPWGNDWRDDGTNWIGSGSEGTSAIATFPLSRSPYGVGDMAGNVFEYTSTLVSRGDTPVSVMKGCSWDDLPGFCRAAYRHTRPIDSRHILFGFRLVKE